MTGRQGLAHWRAVVLAGLWLLLAGSLPILAEGRIALIVANGAYADAPLANPGVDATLVADSLRSIGFSVEIVQDADLGTFDAAIQAFKARAGSADVALFYFAGHGFSITDGGQPRNYLMSTSAQVTSTSEAVLRSGGLPLDEIVGGLSDAAKVALVFIDACRNDPGVRSPSGSGRGLSPVGAGSGGNVFVGMSTRAGDTAADGRPGEGSPFARAFAENIVLGGTRLDDAFTQMRLAVQEETGSQQKPDVGRYDLDSPVVLVAALPDPDGTPSGPGGEVPRLPPEDVKLGFLGDFTGPISALTPPILRAAEIALEGINDEGGILNGGTVSIVSADGGCDAGQAATAAKTLIESEKVTAIVGGLCSGETLGAANGGAVAEGVVLLSPSSTAPALSVLSDSDLVFRVASSDAYQGHAMARLLLSRGIKDVALTFATGDYGRGLANAFRADFEAGGGTVLATATHLFSDTTFASVLKPLVRSGASTLVVMPQTGQVGAAILREAEDTGAFSFYLGTDVLASDAQSLPAAITGKLSITRVDPFAGPGTVRFRALLEAAGLDPSTTYAAQGYDAAFLLALAVEQNGSGGREGLSGALREVANRPGEVILPGEWAKALALIAAGKDINYEGASGPLDFDTVGDVAALVTELEVVGGAIVAKGPVR